MIGTEVVSYDWLTPLEIPCTGIVTSCLIMRLHAGSCWEYVTIESGKEEQGKECMEYVIGHGNTLKCKKEEAENM